MNKAERQANSFQNRLSGVGRTAQKFGGIMSATVTLPIVLAGGAMIKMAADAEESANKFNVVMGEAASSVRMELKALTETIPLTMSQMEAMAAGIQDFLVPMGVVRDEAAGMSADMVKLAGDIASFNNVDPTQVLEAMKSALAGSSEPMRRFGVDTREAALEAIALKEGLITAGQEMDETARAQAVLLKIQTDSTDAMGDAARTVDSTSNLIKFLKRDIKELAESLGKELIPIIRPWLKQLRGLAESFSNLSPATKRIIVQVGLLAAAIGPLLLVLGTAAVVIGALSVPILAVTAAVIGIGAAVVQLIRHWDDLTATAESVWMLINTIVSDAWDDITTSVSDGIDSTIQFFVNLKDRGIQLIKQLYEGIKKWFTNKIKELFVNPAKAAVDGVVGLFSGMKDIIVGNSIVPDMVESIGAEFDFMAVMMDDKSKEATEKVIENFETMKRSMADAFRNLEEEFGLRMPFGFVSEQEWEQQGRRSGESFGESLTKGMLDEIRNSLAKVLRGDLENIFSNLARGVGDIFAQVLSNQITQGFVNEQGGFDLIGGLQNIKEIVSTNLGRAGVGLGIGGAIGGGIPGMAGGALGGIGGGIAGSALEPAITAAATGAFGASIGGALGSAIPVIGTVLGALAGGFLGKALGGLFKDRARFDVEVFNIGNEREIAENLANGVRFFVSDVIRLGLDEAFRDEQIFVKGKGGAEDIAESRVIREQVTQSLTNTVDRIFGIINQLPSDMASMLRDTFRSTELVFDQLIDDASLEFDEGSSDIEDITKRWQQFLEADLPARFLTTIEDFFTSTIQGLGVNAEAAQSFVNDRLEEIKNTESRELRGQLGEEFLQDFNRFVQAFNFAEGNFGGAVEQGINTLNTLAEQIKGLTGEGLPTVERLRLLTQALLSTGDVTQETLDKILQLRDGMVQLAFSVTQSIASLSRTINELGGNTAGALQTSIETLTAMAESDALSLEERQRAIELATGQINQLIQQSQQEQSEQQRRIAEQSRQEIETRIDLLRESESVLQDQLRIIQDQKQLVEEIGGNIQDLLLGPRSIETPFQQLGRARDTIQELFSSLSGATGAERTGIGRRIQDTFNSLLDIGGRAFQQPSLGFRDVFRETVSGLEDLRDEMEPIRSVEEINAQIESIQLRIEALQQRSNSLQETGNDINATIPPELQALRARLQEQAEMILERRLSQLAELGFNEQNLQVNQLTVLEQIRDILASKDMGMGGPRAPLPGGAPTSGTSSGGFIGGWGSFADGGFGNFGLFEMINNGRGNNQGNVININNPVVDSEKRLEDLIRRVKKEVRFDPGFRRDIKNIKAS